MDVQVRYLEAVDQMVCQLVRALKLAEGADDRQQYAIVVTGDHSTPVIFGDHSYEPVPFAASTIRCTVNGVVQMPCVSILYIYAANGSIATGI